MIRLKGNVIRLFVNKGEEAEENEDHNEEQEDRAHCGRQPTFVLR
jgi:hypothetical protein